MNFKNENIWSYFLLVSYLFRTRYDFPKNLKIKIKVNSNCKKIREIINDYFTNITKIIIKFL